MVFDSGGSSDTCKFCQEQCNPAFDRCKCLPGNPNGCPTTTICEYTPALSTCCAPGTVLTNYTYCNGCADFCCKGDHTRAGSCGFMSDHCCDVPVEPGGVMERCDAVLGFPSFDLGTYLCVKPAGSE